jgi:microcystin-dependent protein
VLAQVVNSGSGGSMTVVKDVGGVTGASIASSTAYNVNTGTASGIFTGDPLATHSHSVTAAGTISAPVFTGSALGTHSHSVTAAGTVSAPVFTGSALAAHAHAITAQGGGVAHSILPPYLVVNYLIKT